jgi:hypothetical protein
MANKPIKHRLLSSDAELRENIKAAELVEVLQNHVFGMVTLNQSQTSAAKILLAKCLPDIQMIQMDVSGGIQIEVLQVKAHPPPKKAAVKKAVKK